LRQAYDYWQDQPGNYYPFTLIQSITTATNGTRPSSQVGVHQTSRRVSCSI